MDAALRELRRYARTLINEAAAAPVGVVPMAPPARRPAWSQPFAATVAAAALVFVTAGVAAADSSVPGDLLYPVDRAAEQVGSWFGIGGDAPGERVAEAGVLLARGEVVAALETASESALALVDPSVRSRLSSALDEAISTTEHTTGVPRQDLHVAIGDLIATTHDASAGASHAGDVVDAAHRVVLVARGGAAAPAEAPPDRNDDPPRDSPRLGGGSSASDPSAGAPPGDGLST
jgi:hypothetical protein